jgi:hypothetical protein
MRKILALAAFVAILCVPTWGASIVVGAPNTAPNAFPFGGAGGGAGTVYQQAYASADFTGLGPITISSIDFFLFVPGSLAPSTYSLYFSTITAGIDTLSDTNFSSNLGSDNTLFETESLSGAAPSTLTFAGTPFTYNPADGNLLLEILVSPGGQNAIGGVNAFYEANDGNASGVYSRYHNFGTGTTGFGLVTEFDYSAAVAQTPEPSSILLLGTGILGGFCSLRRRLLS